MTTRVKKYILRDMLGAGISGVLLILSFPKFNAYWCAWFCLIPLYYVVHRASLRYSFVMGCITGFVSSLGIYYWVVVAILADGQSLLLGIASLALLSGYLAIYVGLFAFFAAACIHGHIIKIFPLFAASLWVSLELARTYVFTGFPWLLLGYSQWRRINLIQTAEWWGVYGISFLIVLANSVMFMMLATNKKHKRYFGVFFVVLAVAIGGILMYGNKRIAQYDKLTRGGNKKIAVSLLLQGNIDQYRKWDKSYEQDIMFRYADLVHRDAGNRKDIIIWPETALPGFFEEVAVRQWINGLIRQRPAFHLVGTASVRGGKFFNSIMLLDPDASTVGWYDKKHLVLFGEHIPFKNMLSRFISVFNELGGFEKGTGRAVIPFHDEYIGTSICFEAIFPGVIRKSVNEGAGVLVNLTNDAWFLKSAAPYQHFVMNIFRAVENRRYLIRCANTGISAIIDPTGGIQARTTLGETTVLNGNVFLNSLKTFYSCWGDVFAYACAIVTLTCLLILSVNRRDKILIRED